MDRFTKRCKLCDKSIYKSILPNYHIKIERSMFVKKKILSGALFVLAVFGLFSFTTKALAEEQYATISVLSSGTSEVENNGTANVIVRYTSGNLKWYPKDTSVGRNFDGYWIGIKINAPSGRAADAKYQRWGGTVKFNDVKDGDDYVTAWFGITEERLKQLKEDGEPYTVIVYDFDWDADGKFDDQTVTVQIDPDQIILDEVPDTHATVTVKSIVGNMTFTVEKGKSINEYLSKEEMEKLKKLFVAPEGKRFIGIFKGENEFSLDEKINGDTELIVKFEDIKNEEIDESPKTGVNDSMFFVVMTTLLSLSSIITIKKKA